MAGIEIFAEILHHLARFLPLQMVAGAGKSARNLLPGRFGLGAQKPFKRLAVGLQASIENAAQFIPELLGGLFAYSRQKPHQPHETQFVARIDEEPQIGEHVLGVELFEYADSAGDAMRHMHARKSHLHVDGLEMAAVEHRHVAVAVAHFTILAHEPQNLLRLGLAVVADALPGLVA